LKYSIMINGVTQLFMMKADVLNIFEEIKICTHYELADGTKVDRLTYELNNEEVKPVYLTVPGWYTSLAEVSDYEKFPKELRNYVDLLEKELDVPIKMVSVGPDRKQTILK
jgi:adenylosuccinate synthase